jgi:hypothetical protein
MTLTDSPKQIAEHVGRLARLELQLGLAEVRTKLRGLALTAVFGGTALLLAFLALIVGIGAAAAGLATALDVWAALLVVCGGLALLAALTAVAALRSLRRALPPVPTTALEEARRTIEVLKARNGRGR